MDLSPKHNIGFAFQTEVVDLVARVGILRAQGGARANLGGDGITGRGCRRGWRGGGRGGRNECRRSVGGRARIGQVDDRLGAQRPRAKKSQDRRDQRHERKLKTQWSVARDVHGLGYCPIRHGESTAAGSSVLDPLAIEYSR